MPNGGSDCCGTCWFNSKNDGEPGYHGADKEGEVKCIIRNIHIENPFYTYCINHPHHNPDKIETPLGSVYFGEDRRILIEAPKDEKTRLALLDILCQIEEKPINEYPFGRGLDEEVIVQINNLNEKRAIPSLKEIVKFNPLAQPENENPFNRNRIITIGIAIETLAKLDNNNSLDDIERLTKIGLDNIDKSNYEPKKDLFAPIRYHAIKALKYCSGDEAIQLLINGLIDPHKEINAFAEEILKEKDGVEKYNHIIRDIKEDKNNGKWNIFWKKNK